MTNPVLLMRLEGPLQAWGERSIGDVRDTADKPTKSGIIGLLGCALGYPVRHPGLKELTSGLRFGVRIEYAGTKLEDFHTTRDFLPTANGSYKCIDMRSGEPYTHKNLSYLQNSIDFEPITNITTRFYLEDASFLVGLEETEVGSGLLQACAAALQKPAWPLYLGRKSCIPTRPIFEDYTTDYANLEDALRRHKWSWLGACCKLREENFKLHLPDNLPMFVEPISKQAGDTWKQDGHAVGTARQYQYRLERYLGTIARTSVMSDKGESL